MAENRLGRNIAHYRKQAGLTQEDVGRKLFVSGQAVSRWERGGAPDIELLPKIADALGVSLDLLFGHVPTQTEDVETQVGLELMRTPPRQRLERAYQIAWHMMKVIASANCEPGNSYFRAMTANEDVDRRNTESPMKVPVINYFDTDDGILQSCVAQDFHYVLLMQEPEHGFASVMKNSDAYRRFFAFLAQDHRLDMLVLAYSIPTSRQFTAEFAASQLRIAEAEAEEILEEMYRLHMLQRSEVRISDGVLPIYARHEETLLVPFLYFAGELMHNGAEIYYSLPMRAASLFQAPLGTDSLSPDWLPDPDPRANTAFGAGYSGVK